MWTSILKDALATRAQLTLALIFCRCPPLPERVSRHGTSGSLRRQAHRQTRICH